MDGNFIFKFGKHKGKSVNWVRDNDESYLIWVEECAPNLLTNTPPKTNTVKPVAMKDTPKQTMKPNLNFWNEGPHELSIPYLEKMGEYKKEIKKDEDEWNF